VGGGGAYSYVLCLSIQQGAGTEKEKEISHDGLFCCSMNNWMVPDIRRSTVEPPNHSYGSQGQNNDEQVPQSGVRRRRPVFHFPKIGFLPGGIRILHGDKCRDNL
jgi:hypothetical protein